MVFTEQRSLKSMDGERRHSVLSITVDKDQYLLQSSSPNLCIWQGNQYCPDSCSSIGYVGIIGLYSSGPSAILSCEFGRQSNLMRHCPQLPFADKQCRRTSHPSPTNQHHGSIRRPAPQSSTCRARSSGVYVSDRVSAI